MDGETSGGRAVCVDRAVTRFPSDINVGTSASHFPEGRRREEACVNTVDWWSGSSKTINLMNETVMYHFNYGRIPPVHFGRGTLKHLPSVLSRLGGKRVLLVTGATSLTISGQAGYIHTSLLNEGFDIFSVICRGEPSTAFIDETCAKFRRQAIDAVVGIGGGSVLDAGKAISAMLPGDNSILDHLEGVGRGIPHPGIKTPYIAVPTTSGTGSEATKNAVISQIGRGGYKKSLRHDNLIPDVIIVDSDLLITCPRDITFACGMDAFTQLLEPYLSPKVSRMTEALAWSGLEAVARNFPYVCASGAEEHGAREGMAYAALLSGVALANDGVGIVHGLASPMGGFFPIPHGVVCATLTACSVRANLKALRARAPDSPALEKMAAIGMLLSYYENTGKDRFGTGMSLPCAFPGEGLIKDRDDYCDALLEILDRWTSDFQTPRLGEYGIGEQDLDSILDRTDNRNNPIALTREEIRAMLEERL
uniref:Alcohol dehydrogenase n=1 Tax=Candidatus Kentrum sp. MB TaxID=2138164 RepID=A0A450XPM5_9GAMM|nr:MAG: alcohol dehydrogenase [Candidatus Kentron sp. MB]VFK31261.1 MAG: alcohol dehydrogenase [Candidatus Kentron sp. MB]VFK75422.1 MAG: alcohol dehydrogenase [Candidatus Kentron sp. MB]